MQQRAFDYSYTAFTADGAQWLVDNTDIQLIGIDYLSIAIHDDLTGPHDIVLGAVSFYAFEVFLQRGSVFLQIQRQIIHSYRGPRSQRHAAYRK